jgi:hypothetical protein
MARLNVEAEKDDIKDIVTLIEDYRPGMIPSILSGWLLLQRRNLTAQERATVLASAKNSLELADVEQALRDQWADAELRERDSAAGRGKVFAKGKAYAAEEAIAELTASYCMADLGFAYGAPSDDGLQRSAAYIASWLEVLKSDSRAIFTAAARAQAAADWLHGQQAGPRRSDVGQTEGEVEPSRMDAPADAVTAEAA